MNSELGDFFIEPLPTESSFLDVPYIAKGDYIEHDGERYVADYVRVEAEPDPYVPGMVRDAGVTIVHFTLAPREDYDDDEHFPG